MRSPARSSIPDPIDVECNFRVHETRRAGIDALLTESELLPFPTLQIRQYFVDEDFYAADITARGFCSDGFICEGFSPSSATVKVSALLHDLKPAYTHQAQQRQHLGTISTHFIDSIAFDMWYHLNSSLQDATITLRQAQCGILPPRRPSLVTAATFS